MRINRPTPNNTLPAVVIEGEYVPLAPPTGVYNQPAYRPLPAIEESTLSVEMRDDIKKAQLYAASGYFGVKGAEEAFAKLMYARDLHLPEVLAMTHLFPVNGRLAPDSALMAGMIRRTKVYNYKIVEHTEQRCAIHFLQNGEFIGESVFTIQDAATAGLANKETWKKYPKGLLFARALSQGARWYCPHVILGLEYFPEELGSDVIEDVVE